jgi:dual specificity protein kinase YAK1
MDQFVHKQHICLLFPILSYTLLDLLKDNRYQGLGVKLARRFITVVLEGLLRAEECAIVHADLKPENIMIMENRESPEDSVIKIIDFGSSCFLA